MRTTRRWSVGAFLAIATIMAAALFGAAPANAGYTPGQATTLAVTQSVIAQGGTTTVIGKNYDANVSVQLILHSAPVDLGTVTTDAQGNFSQEVTIPADTPTGAHTIEGLETVGPTAPISEFANITVTSSSPSTGSSSNSGGGLANTGVAVISIGSIGVVLLIGGALMLLASRRRKGTHA